MVLLIQMTEWIKVRFILPAQVKLNCFDQENRGLRKEVIPFRKYTLIAGNSHRDNQQPSTIILPSLSLLGKEWRAYCSIIVKVQRLFRKEVPFKRKGNGCPLKRVKDIVSSIWRHIAVHRRTGEGVASLVEDKVPRSFQLPQANSTISMANSSSRSSIRYGWLLENSCLYGPLG